MNRGILTWVLAGLVILGIIGLWILTIREGDRIVNHSKTKNKVAVPYQSKENETRREKNNNR